MGNGKNIRSGTNPSTPGIPGVEPDIRGAETLRDLLEKHRSMESCQGCHAKFDPLGFALESFNPIGGYREHYRSLNPSAPKVERKVRDKSVQYRVGPKVDSSGEFSDGKSFADIHDFMSGLAENEKLLARSFVRKLLTFATGENSGFPTVKKLSELFPSVPEEATVQEISCTLPYHQISFNPSKCYDSYFHPSYFVEKVHLEGKWNCHRPSFSRCDEPVFGKHQIYRNLPKDLWL